MCFRDINEYLDTVGYKPYTHYASYCVGMATGFLLAAKQKISLSRVRILLVKVFCFVDGLFDKLHVTHRCR